MEIYKKLLKISAELSKQGIEKTKKNKDQGYSFRGIDDVMNTLSPMLVEAGVVIIPRMIDREMRERPTKSGGLLFDVVVKAEFDFLADDGSKVTCSTYGEGMDSSDKATNKAMSGAYKYAIFQTFCIPLVGTDADIETIEPMSNDEKVKLLVKELKWDKDTVKKYMVNAFNKDAWLKLSSGEQIVMINDLANKSKDLPI